MPRRPATKRRWIAAVLLLLAALQSNTGKVAAQTAAQNPPMPALQPGAVVRRIVMKDAQSAELLRVKLESLKSSGLFRDKLPGVDPKQPVQIDISFLVSGNYLLMIGSREWVDANVESVRLMAYMFERPRAHLQLNLRVVQLTGPANETVIQLSETVRALVDAQRDEVVRTFGELEQHLLERLRQREGEDRKVIEAAQELLPGLGAGSQPATVPELLLMIMLDRVSPAPRGLAARRAPGGDGLEAPSDAEAALLQLPRSLQAVLADPRRDDAGIPAELQGDLKDWKSAVTAARDWCNHYAEAIRKAKDNAGIGLFRSALEQPDRPVPGWLARRMLRALDVTERLYPNLIRRHTEQSLVEMGRRFGSSLERAERLEEGISKGEPPPEAPRTERKGSGGRPRDEPKPGLVSGGRSGRALLALKSLAEELVPAPLALFDTVTAAADNSAPTTDQVVSMLREFARERKRLETRFGDEMPAVRLKEEVNYSRLLAIEASLNTWLRRVSEAMSRALEQQFYRRYASELRLLANKELGKGSSKDVISGASLDQVPDVARDLLLADTGVNIFVSNSISLQFAPETLNSVTAQVQAALPSKLGLLERVQQAQQATSALNALTNQFGINGESIVRALLAGGQAVPVQSGINLSANPTIGVDGGTVSLTLSASQTLQPNSDKVADRVTNHSISNATITALSYEPMVLSTLASNISYYEKTGGIPVARKTPLLRDLLKDIPLAPFKEGKREKGIYQSSVLILEPVVIPTIEDVVRYQAGSRR